MNGRYRVYIPVVPLDPNGTTVLPGRLLEIYAQPRRSGDDPDGTRAAQKDWDPVATPLRKANLYSSGCVAAGAARKLDLELPRWALYQRFHRKAYVDLLRLHAPAVEALAEGQSSRGASVEGHSGQLGMALALLLAASQSPPPCVIATGRLNPSPSAGVDPNDVEVLGVGKVPEKLRLVLEWARADRLPCGGGRAEVMLFTPLQCELGGMPTPVSTLPQVTQLAAIGVRVLPVRTLAEAAQCLHARRARWLWQDGGVVAGAVFSLILMLSGLIYVLTRVDTISIFTGASRGTYQQFIKDFAAMAGKEGQNVAVVETVGSRENLKRLINSEEPAWAIVQADLLALYDSKSSGLVKKLRLVFRLYNEEIHVFASKEIKAFSDLQGKRLVVGKQESGNWVTSENLLQKLHIQPREKLYLAPQEGALAVLKGEAEAMIYVAGKPILLFSDYFADLRKQPDYTPLFDKVHFVPLDNLGLSSGYQPAEITPGDYPWIDRKVPTLSTQAIVISLDYFSFPRLCQKMFTLGQSVRNHIAGLRQNGHPKWREVDLDGTVNIRNLERDVCSRESTDDIVKTLAETADGQSP